MATNIDAGEVTWQEDARAVAAIVGRDAGAGRVYNVAYQYYLDQGFAAQHADEHAITLSETWDDFYPPRSILRQNESDVREAEEWVRYQHHQASRAACCRQAQAAQAAIARARTTGTRTRARRSPTARQAGSRRSGSSSGDGSGSTDGGDPEPPRYSEYAILDYRRLAERWNCHARSLANIYSRDPAALPPSIAVPGTRGPRWRLADVEEFEAARRRQPDPPKRKRGRPRIAGGRP